MNTINKDSLAPGALIFGHFNSHRNCEGGKKEERSADVKIDVEVVVSVKNPGFPALMLTLAWSPRGPCHFYLPRYCRYTTSTLPSSEQTQECTMIQVSFPFLILSLTFRSKRNNLHLKIKKVNKTRNQNEPCSPTHPALPTVLLQDHQTYIQEKQNNSVLPYVAFSYPSFPFSNSNSICSPLPPRHKNLIL